MVHRVWRFCGEKYGSRRGQLNMYLLTGPVQVPPLIYFIIPLQKSGIYGMNKHTWLALQIWPCLHGDWLLRSPCITDLQIPEHPTNITFSQFILLQGFSDKQRLIFSQPDALLILPSGRVMRTNSQYLSRRRNGHGGNREH
eukprot:397580-Pelagomonas_calceolata.AAC.3